MKSINSTITNPKFEFENNEEFAFFVNEYLPLVSELKPKSASVSNLSVTIEGEWKVEEVMEFAENFERIMDGVNKMKEEMPMIMLKGMTIARKFHTLKDVEEFCINHNLPYNADYNCELIDIDLDNYRITAYLDGDKLVFSSTIEYSIESIDYYISTDVEYNLDDDEIKYFNTSLEIEG